MKKPPRNGRPDAENPEWTADDFRRATRVHSLDDVKAFVRKHRGPQRAPRKVAVSLRLDRDVCEQLRSSGRGWQTRVNAVIKRAIKRGTL
jgi:uncharacterized protein (DUF4415 family)